MKRASVVASVILAGAVLLAAYAVGRLIRQSRLDVPETPAQRVVEPNDFNTPEAMTGGRRINQKREEPTPEDLAREKQAQAEKLAEMSNLTEEEKQQFHEEIRRGLRSKRREPGQVPRLSPEELKEASKRWPEMSEEEKAAFRARMRGPRSARARPSRQVTNESSSPSEPNAPDPNAAKQN